MSNSTDPPETSSGWTSNVSQSFTTAGPIDINSIVPEDERRAVEVSWVSSSSSEEEEHGTHDTMETSGCSSSGTPVSAGLSSAMNYSDPTLGLAESDVQSMPAHIVEDEVPWDQRTTPPLKNSHDALNMDNNSTLDPPDSRDASYYFRPISPTSQISHIRGQEDPPPSDATSSQYSYPPVALGNRLLKSLQEQTLSQEEQDDPADEPLDQVLEGQQSMDQPHENRHDSGGEQGLSWRTRPEYSLSDWKLEIFNRSTRKFHTYNVHRVILGAGSRSCGFFRDMFAHPMETGDEARVTRLPFIAEACNLFPDLLDFLYSDRSFQLKPENAVGLAFLAHFLEQPLLLQQSMEFVNHDLRRDNMHTYLVDAQYYDQFELVEWILQFGARELPAMAPDSPATEGFLSNLAPSMFSQVLELIPEEERCSPNLSALLVEFCFYHKHNVTLLMLEDWTSQLPILSSEAAASLLDLELILREKEEVTMSATSPFEKRCLEILSNDWEAMCDMDRRSVEQLVDRIVSTASMSNGDKRARKPVVDWFSKTLYRARTELQSTQMELHESWEKTASHQEELSKALRELEQSTKEASALKRSLESTKSELRGQLSGWMQKRTNDLMEHQASEQCWNHEREVWKQQHRQWLAERNELEVELQRMKSKLAYFEGLDCNESFQGRKDACQVDTGDILSYISGAGPDDESWCADQDDPSSRKTSARSKYRRV